jgi:hypothetical protein
MISVKLVQRTYDPKGYLCDITVNVTEEQAIALDKLWEKKEFDAYFWAEKVQWLNNNNTDEYNYKVARINGQHHIIGNEGSQHKGCGGRKHIIKFKDGKIVETTNLWHQGEIPEELKNILVDNAEWEEN